MTNYFEIDAKRQLLLFKNTGTLAEDISKAVDGIRQVGDFINADFGKWLEKKTPGKTLVMLGVRLALHDNAFNYGTTRMYYPGVFGPVTRVINSKVNAKLSTVFEPIDLVAVGAGALAETMLAQSKVPQSVIPSVAKAIGCAVSYGAKSGEVPGVQDAKKARDNALKAGKIVAEFAQKNSKNASSLISVDTDKNLIKFKGVDKFAKELLATMEKLRPALAGIPMVGVALENYVKVSLFDEAKVKIAANFLTDNAFNYKTGHFESEGVFANMVNAVANYAIGEELSAESIATKALEFALTSVFLSGIPDVGDLSKSISAELQKQLKRLSSK